RINPFDEPNVQQAKDATKKLLGQYQQTGALPRTTNGHAIASGIELSASEMARKYLGPQSPDHVLSLIRQGDYFVLLAYLGPDDALERELQALRNGVVD